MKTRTDRELLSKYLYWERRAERPSEQLPSTRNALRVAERMHPTARQLQAQRRNVRHSTGPRTREGKHRSSLNSTKWRIVGLFRQTTMALTRRNPFQFRRLQRYLLHLFQPWDSPSEQRVAYLASVWWKKIGAPRPLPLPQPSPQSGWVAQLESQLMPRRTVWQQNRSIEMALQSCISILADHNRQWKHVLSKRMGRPLGPNLTWGDLRRAMQADLNAARISGHGRHVVHFTKTRISIDEGEVVDQTEKKSKKGVKMTPF